MGQDENAEGQKWVAAVGPGWWRRQQVEVVRPVVAGVVVMTAF